MPISFECPQCGKKLKSPDEAAGKSSKCPGCGAIVTCPEPIYDAEAIDESQPAPGHDPYADPDDDKSYGMVNPPPAAPPSGESRRPCPMCGEMIIATAAKCRYCGEVFDPALKKRQDRGGKGGANKEIRAIAVSQRYLIICALIQIVAIIGLLIATPASRSSPGVPVVAAVLLLSLMFWGSSFTGMVFACMLANKVYGLGAAILVVFLGLMPCVGLLTLLVVNGKATRTLRNKGYHVGFLGPNLSDF